MFPDFIEYGELKKLCSFQYYRTLGSRPKRCPYTNKEDAIQGAIVKCWEVHKSYDPSRSKKSTFLLFVIRHYYLDLIVRLRAKMRACPTREVDIDTVVDVWEDHRLTSTGEVTNPRKRGRRTSETWEQARAQRNERICKMAREGRSNNYIGRVEELSGQHIGRILVKEKAVGN